MIVCIYQSQFPNLFIFYIHDSYFCFVNKFICTFFWFLDSTHKWCHICLSLSDLIHSVWQSLGPSMLLQMTVLHSFYDWVIFHCISIPHLSDLLLSLDSSPFFSNWRLSVEVSSWRCLLQSSMVVPWVCLVPASHSVHSLFHTQCLWSTNYLLVIKEMGIPDHLTCLLRNLHEGWEATARTRHETTDCFQME